MISASDVRFIILELLNVVGKNAPQMVVKNNDLAHGRIM